MQLRKWDYAAHEYKTFEVPDEWNVTLWSPSMLTMVNCPHCGRKLAYGDSYTSLEIHNEFGLGYAVCEDCYKKELERKYADAD